MRSFHREIQLSRSHIIHEQEGKLQWRRLFSLQLRDCTIWSTISSKKFYFAVMKPHLYNSEIHIFNSQFFIWATDFRITDPLAEISTPATLSSSGDLVIHVSPEDLKLICRAGMFSSCQQKISKTPRKQRSGH